jgi:hypothetical protein
MEKQKIEPKQALEILAQVIMDKVQGTGKEHAIYNMALNAIHELVNKEGK